MSLVINTNVQSLIAQRALHNNTLGLNRSVEKLSTGFRINRAADDAAGLSISENLKAQANGAVVAKNNAQDAQNMIQIADGDLSIIGDHLQRMHDLAIQAGNDTNSAEARTAIQAEIDARAAEITRISDSSEFNGIMLLDGSATDMILQIGPKAADTFSIDASLWSDVNAGVLSVSGATLDTATAAQDFLGKVSTAINTIATRRGSLGAIVNRLDGVIESLSVKEENLRAANSRIRDVDVATEAAKLTKFQILQQASLSLLAQANQAPSTALSLI